jgi:hypothetical protein
MALQLRFGQYLSLHCTLKRNSSRYEPCYRCLRSQPTWILVFLSFVCLPARSLLGLCMEGHRHLLSCAQRSAIFCSLRRRWRLSCWVQNFAHRLLFLGKGPSFQRRIIISLLFLSAITFNCQTARPSGSRLCRSLTLSPFAASSFLAGVKIIFLWF